MADSRISFDGTAGMIRQQGGKTSLAIFDGKRIALGGRVLESSKGDPRSLQLDDLEGKRR